MDYSKLEKKMKQKKNIKIAISPYNKDQAIYTDYWSLINKSLLLANDSYPRLSAIRFDLRIPDIRSASNSLAAVMKRFFTSLQSKIKHNSNFKAHAKTQYLRYIWVKEKGNEKNKEHYHVCLFLNKDDFGYLGQYRESKRGNKTVKNTLRESIVQAWATASNIELLMAERLVYFGERPVHWLNKKKSDYFNELNNVKKRLCYMAKVETKEFLGRKIGIGKYEIYKPNTNRKHPLNKNK